MFPRLMCVLILILCVHQVRGSSTRHVLKFGAGRDQNYQQDNLAIFKVADGDSPTETDQLSVCFRYQPRYDENIAIFNRNDYLQFQLVNLRYGFGYININENEKSFDLKNKGLGLSKWHHVCFTVDQDEAI